MPTKLTKIILDKGSEKETIYAKEIVYNKDETYTVILETNRDIIDKDE